VYLATSDRFGIGIDAEKQTVLTNAVRDFWARRAAYAAADLEACLREYAGS
jgi:hypothetical protein